MDLTMGITCAFGFAAWVGELVVGDRSGNHPVPRTYSLSHSHPEVTGFFPAAGYRWGAAAALFLARMAGRRRFPFYAAAHHQL